MKKSSISMAIVAAIVAGGIAAPNALAADPISGTKVTDVRPQSDDANGGYRFVVQYRDGAIERADAQRLKAGLDAAAARSGITRSLAGGKTSAARAPASARLLRSMAAPGFKVVTTSRTLSAGEAEGFLRELRADPAVVTAEIDHLYRHMADAAPAAAPNDPNYAQYQWNFNNVTGGVRAEQAWETSTGEGVVVAVLDTGVVQDHLDLAANILPGYDMISDQRLSRRDSDDRVPGGWDVGDWVEENYCTALGAQPHPADVSSWHGSHVSGTIAQETNNGRGLAGIAHGAKVVPVRVLGSCGGFGSDIADGIIWAAGGSVAGIPDNENPAEVINMSLGSGGPAQCSASYQAAIDQANALGSIIVVAAGNSNANAANYTMSSCNNVISVGATGITGAKAGYSNYGARVDLSAPGGGGGVDGNPNGYIWQVVNGGEQGPTAEWFLGGMTGTSMASPHVAAAAALVQSALSGLDRDPLDWEEMRDLLTSTARPFPVTIPTSTPMGAGILDLERLLDKATEEPCDPAVEECVPDSIPLANGTPLRQLTGTAGSETLYSIEVPAGVTGPLSITTSGGSGDVSLHVSLDEAPEDTGTWNSTRPGNSETIRINAPAAGIYYIKLAGNRAYTNVTLQARFTAPQN